MIYNIDIDGVICTEYQGVPDRIPHKENIVIINRLFEQGHSIVLQTARGMKSGKNNGEFADNKYRKLTEDQLSTWGVNYTSLHFGKVNADVYIDNKGLPLSSIKQSNGKKAIVVLGNQYSGGCQNHNPSRSLEKQDKLINAWGYYLGEMHKDTTIINLSLDYDCSNKDAIDSFLSVPKSVYSEYEHVLFVVGLSSPNINNQVDDTLCSLINLQNYAKLNEFNVLFGDINVSSSSDYEQSSMFRHVDWEGYIHNYTCDKTLFSIIAANRDMFNTYHFPNESGHLAIATEINRLIKNRYLEWN